MFPISLVIPVYNEAATIPTLLKCIAHQTHQPDEIVFVDGGSTDNTVSLLQNAIPQNSYIRVVEAGRATPGKGRNIGIAAASYEWIALTDAGICLEPSWLEQLVQAVEENPKVTVVYGNYEPITNSYFESCAALVCPAPKQQRPGGWMRGPVIPSSLIRRDVWEAVGGFPDLRAAEDLIFMERIQEQGFSVAWVPTATVWWQLQPNLGAIFRKFVLYSKHNVWANRQQYWHYGIARQYLVALVFLVLAFINNLWWLAVPIFGFLARVSKSIWLRRETRGLFWLLNPIQFFGVAVILTAIDLATFVGWMQAFLIQSSHNNLSKNQSEVQL